MNQVWWKELASVITMFTALILSVYVMWTKVIPRSWKLKLKNMIK